MIGAINGPDAPAAVAWLELSVAAYTEWVAERDALRVMRDRRWRRWRRANPGRPTRLGPLTVEERKRLNELEARVGRFRLANVHHATRPMFELLHGDRGLADSAARWPTPFMDDQLDGWDDDEEEQTGHSAADAS